MVFTTSLSLFNLSVTPSDSLASGIQPFSTVAKAVDSGVCVYVFLCVSVSVCVCLMNACIYVCLCVFVPVYR